MNNNAMSTIMQPASTYGGIFKYEGKKVGHQFTIAWTKHLRYWLSLLNYYYMYQ